MSVQTVWWPELHAGFALSITPAMLMSGSRPPTPVTLAVTPAVGMTAAMRGAASFGVTLAPQLGMAVPLTTPASFGVGVTSQVGASAVEHYARAFTFGVTPTVGVSGALRRVGSFALSVTPAIGMAGVQHIARITGVVYTQSSIYTGCAAATYANMNDDTASGSSGATATDQATAGTDQWIRADAGSSQFISRIEVGYDYLTNLPGGWGALYTENMSVQGSNNGTSWTAISTTPVYSGSPTNGLRSVTVNATWRYIRLLRLAASNDFVAATEFSLWS